MMEPSKPLITRRHNGEYSTIRYPDGMIETVWFGDDGNDVTVGRTFQGLRETADKHIDAFESKEEV